MNYYSEHKEQLLEDRICECFNCLEIFNPQEITEWNVDLGETSLCSYCDVDSVIGESSGYPITK